MHQRGDRPGVLVVDDECSILDLIVATLHRNGFDVWSADNGNDAISLYRQHADEIDIVLLDVRMAGLDGPQTLDGLRQLNSEVIACFMSGSLGSYQREELMTTRGAKFVFDKPFHLDELVDALRSLVAVRTA